MLGSVIEVGKVRIVPVFNAEMNKFYRCDLLVGDIAKLLDLAQKISPSLVDSLLLLTGFNLQRSHELKSEDAPNNFYQPVAENDRVDGDYKNLVIPSITDFLGKLPLFQVGTGVLLALLAAQAFKQNE